MEYLAYNVGGNNLEALCIPCHIKTHQEMKSFDRENVQANKQRKRDMFLQRNDPNYVASTDDDCKPTTDIEPISK